MLKIVTICLLVFLSACVTTEVLETSSSYDDAASSYIHQQGSNTVTGQAFLRRNDGVVVYAAGSTISIFPATTYSKERIGLLYNGRKYLGLAEANRKKFSNTDDRYLRASRETKLDGEGRFEFKNLADGSYMLTTNVTWFIGENTQGGYLLEDVTVSNGESKEVILSGE